MKDNAATLKNIKAEELQALQRKIPELLQLSPQRSDLIATSLDSVLNPSRSQDRGTDSVPGIGSTGSFSAKTKSTGTYDDGFTGKTWTKKTGAAMSDSYRTRPDYRAFGDSDIAALQKSLRDGDDSFERTLQQFRSNRLTAEASRAENQSETNRLRARSAPVARPNGTASNRCLANTEYFNPKTHPKLAQFLKDVQVGDAGIPKDKVDLSYLYPEPQVQGHSVACAAFALASDMASVLNGYRFKGPKYSFDEEYVYARIIGRDYSESISNKHLPEGVKGNLRAGKWGALDQGVESIVDALALLQHRSSCDDKGLVAHPSGPESSFFSGKPAKHEYVVDKFATADFSDGEDKPDACFLKMLLDNGISPVVGIDTDARRIQEDWIQTPGKPGNIGHVVNLVGYGEDVDPFDLQKKPYFIIRDSFTGKPMHYKISQDDLIKRLDELDKITKLRQL